MTPRFGYYPFMMLSFLGLALSITGCQPRSFLSPTPPPQVELPLPQAGFEKAIQPRIFHFPLDQGPHPNFQTEWWYYTGNLETPEGHHFGFQLTFFRRSLLPPQSQPQRSSAWATTQIYMGHLALTDVSEKRFRFQERFSREALGLAGAQGEPRFGVWLEDWSVVQLDENRYQLLARTSEIGLDLILQDQKGFILQGDQGLSRKGEEPGNASYYISQTRLIISGQIRSGKQAYSVQGVGWMDHEFSTSALGKDQVGWDWFALQLDDGSDLMFFILRDNQGNPTPYSSGSLITPDGEVQPLGMKDVQIEVLHHWTSPHSGAIYPSQWYIRLPSQELALRVSPYIEDQELRVSFTYWEGAVKVEGSRAGMPIRGVGYVELTGYAGSMQGQF